MGSQAYQALKTLLYNELFVAHMLFHAEFTPKHYLVCPEACKQVGTESVMVTNRRDEDDLDHLSDVEVLKRLIAYAVDEALRCDQRMCADLLTAGLRSLERDETSLSHDHDMVTQIFREN